MPLYINGTEMSQTNNENNRLFNEQTFVNASGDSMIGELNMNNQKIKNLSTPTDDGDACNKQYLEAKLNQYIATIPNQIRETYINASGDSMRGELNMTKHKIKNLPTPTDNGDACNKEYVDNYFISFSKEMKRFIDYKIILTFEPTFWISSYYSHGVDTSDLIEISGYGMNKIQGEYRFANVNGVTALIMDGILSIVSKTTYDLKLYIFPYCIGKSNTTRKNI